MKPSPPREEALFQAAILLAAAERASFLNGACHGDPALRQRLEALVAAHEQTNGVLADGLVPIGVPPSGGPPLPPAKAGIPNAPAAKATLKLDMPDSQDEALGTRISHYKLLQRVGEGGCGVVYMAEQEEPVRRRVALKVIKLGMDTKSVVARFEAERQALAMMDHPNIAKVLDAGTTETGRPYFVMELVRGIKITDYCDQNHLSTEARLELFISICQAVQHAHQKGIIHRDLKPSNILVTLHDGVPVPKVIDFGIAKAIEQKLTDKTLFTELHQFIGTPAYMSPEQAEMSGLDIDTRSDIYSLGVLLYELLTGQTPFDARELIKDGLDAIRRTIREVEPPRPSTRLSTLGDADLDTVAKARGTGTLGLRSALRGDLDWIVMKCLEKDRTRRYDTANGLAMDLKRHLTDEPVIAGPPSTTYKFRKFARRNKVAFAMASSIAAVLVIATGISVWQAVRAHKAEHQALATVEELRRTAPAFAEQARALVAQSKFDEAITKLDYAVALRADVVDYLVSKANLLQCQLKLPEAVAGYRAVLKVVPDEPRAKANLKLTEELLRTQSANQGKLSSQELAKLLSAMQTEQRSAAELLPVSERLGQEKDILLAYWLDRLKELPVPADKPLKQRLSMGDTGRLVLDLSGTAISDLSPLSGMPLGWLSLESCRNVVDLSPLRGMPLRTLALSDTAVTNIAPLQEITTLVVLHLQNTKITNLDPLRGLKLQSLYLTGCENVTDIQPLTGMPLTRLYLRSTSVTSLAPLRGMPLKELDLTSVPARDFEALSGLPLENLDLQSVNVSDLSFLRGMPLKELALWRTPEARGYAVLSEIKTLEVVLLPQSILDLPEDELRAIDALQQSPALRQIANQVRSGLTVRTETGSKEQFWRRWEPSRAMQRGEYQAAEELLAAEFKESQSKKSRTHPETESALRRLINCQIAASRFKAVAASLRKLLDLHIERGVPRDAARESLDWQMLAGAQVLMGTSDEYRRTCQEFVQRLAGDSDPEVPERVLKVCSLAPDSGVNDALLEKFRSAALGAGFGKGGWLSFTLGLAEYRAGRWDSAVQILKGVALPDGMLEANIASVLAMTYYRQGDLAKAQERLRRARDVFITMSLRGGNPYLFDNWLQLNALVKEATALIEGDKPGTDAKPGNK